MTKSVEIQISDLHIGSKFAVMHPHSDYKANQVQRWLFKTWNIFLDNVQKILDEQKPDYVHLSELGDLGELDYAKRNASELWTQDPDDIVANHAELLEPLHKLANSVHFVRGTKAHIGEDGGIDEKIARDCDISVHTNTKLTNGKFITAGQYAEFSLSGVHFEIAHHGKNKSKWTDINTLVSLGNEILLKRTKNGQKAPDVVSRGHFHYGEHTPFDKKPYVIAVPSWQLPNNYAFRVDATVETPHVGGHVVVVEDGEIMEGIRLRYFYPRSKIECLIK